MIGTTIAGHYKIVNQLGSGGFGETYLAQDTHLPGESYCVVKQLKPQTTDPNTLEIARRLFKTEAEILHQLGTHDRIPRLFAYFEENQQFYLVQEFVEGHDLGQELTPGKQLSETYVIKLLQDILEVLAFVHQRNVIHRDLKPLNIRRRKDGKIVLIDFGAVREVKTLVVNSQGQTSVSVAIGTPGYMPTEQASGKPRLSSDIYAVGMIGIQAITGLLPHQLLEDSATGEIIWRNGLQVNTQLADILDKMVRFHFPQRYPSAVEALQAVQQLANSYTPTQPVTNLGYTPTPSPNPQPISPLPIPQTTPDLGNIENQPSVTPKPSSSSKVALWVVGGLGIILLSAISLQTFHNQNQVAKGKQGEAKNNISFINKAQTSYRAESNKFADTFDRLALGTLQGNTEDETENYSYKIVVANQELTIITATAKDPALKSYAGAATRYTNSASQSVITSVICETSSPSTTPPQIPQITGRAPKCPPDSTELAP